MRKFFATFAGLAALTFASGAHAAAITFSEGSGTVLDDIDGDVLGPGSVVAFNVEGIENGDSDAFSFMGSFINNSDIDAAGAATVIAFQPTVLSSISNLTLRFFDNLGYEETINVTNANGEPLGLVGFDVHFFLNIAEAASEVWVEVMGDAVPADLSGLTPGLQVQLSQIPLPGALPLLMAGLAGLGFATGRKRKAA